MGLRFRKSIKVAPGVKINLNKNSTSVSFGKRGAHYTINSKGKKTATVGIPGTGISYSQSTGGGKSSKKPKHKGGTTMFQNNNSNYDPSNDKKWYQKTGWIIALLILFFPVGLFLMWKYANWKKPVKGIVTALILVFAFIGMVSPAALEQINLSADTDTVYDINQKVKISATTTPDDYELSKDDFHCSDGKLKVSGKSVTFVATKDGSYTIWAQHDGVTSNKLTIKIEDKAAIAKKEAEEKAKAEKIAEEKAKQEEAEKAAQAEAQAAAQAQAQAEAQAQQQQAQAQENNEPTVYITNTGSKYHRAGCRTLRSSKIEKHLSEVRGTYSPCGICNPPQ